MNTFLANFKTLETNSNVSSKYENSWSSFNVDSGRFDCVFIRNHGRFGAKSKLIFLLNQVNLV